MSEEQKESTTEEIEEQYRESLNEDQQHEEEIKMSKDMVDVSVGEEISVSEDINITPDPEIYDENEKTGQDYHGMSDSEKLEFVKEILREDLRTFHYELRKVKSVETVRNSQIRLDINTRIEEITRFIELIEKGIVG